MDFSISKRIFIVVLLTIGMIFSAGTATLNGEDQVAGQQSVEVLNKEAAEEAPPGLLVEENEESAWYENIFVQIIGVVIVLLGLFLAYICLPVLPAFQSKLKPESVVEHIGKANGKKGKKVLLGYVTRHGTSSTIAQKIYDVLAEKGHNIDMRFIPNIPDEEVAKYDFFIIGSSVYWVMAKEFVNFVEKHRGLLKDKPVAVFNTCMTIQRDTPKNRERVEAYFTSGLKTVPEIKPIDKQPFAGKVDMTNLNSMEKGFLHFLFAVTPLKGGDHRDFDKITEWSEKISGMI